MASFSRDWTCVLPELLELIIAKLYRLSDYIRFCGVCRQWRLAGLESDTDHKENLILLRASRKKLPMLMFRTEEHSNNTRGLYSVSDGMTYNIKLPRPRDKFFFGSSHGWLMYLEENHSITLLNPLSNRCISLPIFDDDDPVYFDELPTEIKDYYLLKGILSDDPLVNPDNYIFAVLYSGMKYLAIYKAGDLHWKFIETILLSDYMELLGERFLLMEDKEDLPYEEMRKCFIVVVRETTTDFRIFKLVVCDKNIRKWVQISEIGEQAFFVGLNHSLSVSTEEFVECTSNSIYYVSHLLHRIPPYECCGLDEDSGVFNLEDGSFHSHHLLDNFEWYTEPPFWFVPNPDFSTSA